MRPRLYSANPAATRPVGVFDSGLGGLTLVRQIRRKLPSESIVYFGDLARLPYGTKSKEQILSFSIQNTLFLMKHKVKAVVIACNSSSSVAYAFLKRHFKIPVFDVIAPAAERAAAITRAGRIGVIATQATIDSLAYEKAIRRLLPKAKVNAAACPLFVPMVEEGWLEGKITTSIIEFYLRPLLKTGIDTLILGCTHYQLLRETIQEVIGPRIKVVDSVEPAVGKMSEVLLRENLHAPRSGQGELRIYLSDKPRNFIRVGEKFLQKKMNHVEVVRQK